MDTEKKRPVMCKKCLQLGHPQNIVVKKKR